MFNRVPQDIYNNIKLKIMFKNKNKNIVNSGTFLGRARTGIPTVIHSKCQRARKINMVTL